MSRIESAPAGAGQQRLNPCVARQFRRRGVRVAARSRSQIAGNIARRNSGQAQQTNSQMREILTFTTAQSEYVVNGRVYMGGAAVIIKLTAYVMHHAFGVCSDVFG